MVILEMINPQKLKEMKAVIVQGLQREEIFRIVFATEL